MAENTYGTYLMTKKADKWEKLIDIKDYPDIGGDPESLETTTLSNPMPTYIFGILSTDTMQFTHNYTIEDYKKLLALKGQQMEFAVWFGHATANDVVTPDGSNGKFSFTGEISVKISGKGVNDVREMVSTIAPSTPITVE